MNFTQMHERLRQELLRRIQRGSLSVSLLARQTGLGQPHLSNFLHSRRQLSLEAMDRILSSQLIGAEDLIVQSRKSDRGPGGAGEGDSVPVVSQQTALFEPIVRAGAVQMELELPKGVLEGMRERTSASRRAWQRFVAIRVAAADAVPMEPLLMSEALVLLDRHYNSLVPYRMSRPNLYAVRLGSHLTIRYVDFISNRLVLRPHNISSPVELIEVEAGESPGDLIAGRVALILNET